eukprot:RCo019285
MVSKDSRVHFRRHRRWNTAKNKIKKVRVPGGNVTAHYFKRLNKGLPRNPISLGHQLLRGIPATTPMERHKLPRKMLSVNRPYGGTLSHDIVRDRIIRSFLIEEQKIVKRVLKAQNVKDTQKKKAKERRAKKLAKKGKSA